MPSLLPAGARCILRRLSALSLPSQPHLHRFRTRKRHVACNASPQVPIPLCQRPAMHVDSLGAVLAWQGSVLQAVEHIGRRIEQTADGPSVEELKREITWALDDAVEGLRQANDEAWQAQTWQQLQSELRVAERRGVDACRWQLRLRASVRELEQLWQQRLQDRVPFQYLINTTHWRTYILSVGPGILVPRPETEQLIDMAAAALAARPQLAHAPWADLGTGSGAIAIGLADALKQHSQAAQVWAVDLSPVATAYAAHNAKACGAHSVVSTALGSWYEPLQQQGLQGRLGGIVSNPPYIPRAQMDTLQAEVGRHEPWSALDGGPGPGLESLDPICRGAVGMLMPGGFLALETAGGEQAHQVATLLQALGPGAFEHVTVQKDCYGVERFVTATRSTDEQ